MSKCSFESYCRNYIDLTKKKTTLLNAKEQSLGEQNLRNLNVLIE